MSRRPVHTLAELSTILDSLPDYVYVVELETMRILYANRAYTLLMGRDDPDSVIGKTAYDLYPMVLVERFAAQNQQIVTDGQTFHVLETLEMHFGTFHVDTYKMPLYGEDGAVYAILGTSRDMTEMERMRQTLARRTEELEQTNQLLIASGGFLQSVLDNQSSSIAVIHLDGSIRVVNARWRWSVAENGLVRDGRNGLGLNYFTLCRDIIGSGDEAASEVERGLRALLDGTIPEFIFEFQQINSDGEATWLEIRASRFMSLNAPHAVIAHTDITVRKAAELRTEESLRHEKELSDLKSRFLSLVAHEFRTPITIIQSSLDMVMYYSESMTPDRQESQFQKILGQLKRLMALIDEISFLYRMQNSVMNIQLAPVAIVPFLEQVISEVELVYGRTGEISLTTGGLSGEASFLLDELLLHQIFFNLISNAVKYSASGTPITILVGMNETALGITVADHGIGILPEDLKRLFEPFFRGSNVNERNGTGLGLSIVEQSVQALNGILSVSSEVGAGTTFTVSLPL